MANSSPGPSIAGSAWSFSSTLTDLTWTTSTAVDTPLMSLATVAMTSSAISNSSEASSSSSSELIVDDGSASNSSEPVLVKVVVPKRAKRVMRYSEHRHLQYGFIASPTDDTKGFCLICEEVVDDLVLRPPLLRAHLAKKHPKERNRDLEYFQQLRDFIIGKFGNSRSRPNLATINNRAAAMCFESKLADALHSTKLSCLAREWLLEQCPSVDPSSLLLPRKKVTATIFCSQNMALAGYRFVEAILAEIGGNICRDGWFFEEGTYVLNNSGHSIAFEGKSWRRRSRDYPNRFR